MNRVRFRCSLLRWFDRERRDLPWRKNPTLYRVWISEVMLQQTRVETVIPYFQRFLRKFPDVRALAQADLQDVLRSWEGLGYYRRARQLHQAAVQIMKNHGGRFPRRLEEVLALPGIGRYTAGAILSIGASQPHPVLEGNTIRLYARLMNYRENVRSSSGQAALWDFARTIVDTQRPGDLNQALMELGSLICIPDRPLCNECPVRQHCMAYAAGDPESLPNVGPARKRLTAEHHAAVIIARADRVLLRRYAGKERWAGLWDFPRFPFRLRRDEAESRTAIAESLLSLTGLKVELAPASMPPIRHTVTRFRMHLSIFHGRRVSGRLRPRNVELEWVRIADLAVRPMSVTGRKIARWIAEQSNDRFLGQGRGR